MNDWIALLGFVAVWVLLQRWLLPKLGVAT